MWSLILIAMFRLILDDVLWPIIIYENIYDTLNKSKTTIYNLQLGIRIFMNVSAFTTASEFLALFYYYGTTDVDRKVTLANKNAFN